MTLRYIPVTGLKRRSGRSEVPIRFLTAVIRSEKADTFDSKTARIKMRKTLSILGLLAMCVTQTLSHGDDSHFENGQDVQVKTTKVSGNVYMMQGRGGNV